MALDTVETGLPQAEAQGRPRRGGDHRRGVQGLAVVQRMHHRGQVQREGQRQAIQGIDARPCSSAFDTTRRDRVVEW